jgi:hypothetical protein
MKISSLLFINLFLIGVNAKSQDGSDMRYINIEDVDTSYIGKTVHIDFYSRSFASRKRDTITILVNNKTVVFIEHREDDGFNNWFSRQYLEGIKNAENESLRIVKSMIKEITEDSILVTSSFIFYKNKELIESKSFTQDIWFRKNIISQILVKSEQCCK